jgi:hypothetical protein
VAGGRVAGGGFCRDRVAMMLAPMMPGTMLLGP